MTLIRRPHTGEGYFLQDVEVVSPTQVIGTFRNANGQIQLQSDGTKNFLYSVNAANDGYKDLALQAGAAATVFVDATTGNLEMVADILPTTTFARDLGATGQGFAEIWLEATGTASGRGLILQQTNGASVSPKVLFYNTADEKGWSIAQSPINTLVFFESAIPNSSTGDPVMTLSTGGALDVDASYSVATTKVVGAQGAAVADAAGGGVVDTECRAAVNALLARVRTHGLIGT